MWHWLPETEDEFSALATHTSLDKDSEIVFDGPYPPSDEQGAIFAEALNVHEQTGMTPAQLQARVAELEAALRQAARLEQTDRGGLGLHLAGWAE